MADNEINRREQLDDLILFLSKVTDEDLEKVSVETIIEGYWLSLYNADREANAPFQLEG